MPETIHDYTEANPPELHLTKPIMHPTNNRNVIGHIGLDKAGGNEIAVFPRQKDEHWFRGQSTNGLTGYGVSEDVLNYLTDSSQNIRRLIIIETDTARVIEYDIADFENAQVVAYSPKLEQCVIGDEAMRVDDELYCDRQRVLPVEQSRRTFRRADVTIYQ